MLLDMWNGWMIPIMFCGILQSITLNDMEKEIIYIKYDGLDMGEASAYCDDIESTFSKYPWGGGFRVENFRYDQSYFYCDAISEIYTHDDYGTARSTFSYMQGMISGFLLAKGIEII